MPFFDHSSSKMKLKTFNAGRSSNDCLKFESSVFLQACWSLGFCRLLTVFLG